MGFDPELHRAPTPDQLRPLPAEAWGGLQSERQTHRGLREKIFGRGRRTGGERPHGASDEARAGWVSRELHHLAPETSGRVRQAADAVRTTAGEFRQDPLATTQDVLARTRDARLQAEAANAERSRWRRAVDSTGGKIAKTVIEMIPSPVGYGPGDLLTLGNAIRGFRSGKDLAGSHMDKVDSSIHLIAALIPGVPATPVVEVARKVRQTAEDASHKLAQRRAAQDQERHPQHPAGPPRHY